MSGCDCVPVKLYLQNSRIWPVGSSVPTPALNHWAWSPKSSPFISGNEDLVSSVCFSINSSTLILNTNSIVKEYPKDIPGENWLTGFREVANWSLDVFFKSGYSHSL